MTVRIQIARVNGVKPSGLMKSPSRRFWAQSAGELANLKAVHQMVCITHLGIQFQNAFFFKDLNKYR